MDNKTLKLLLLMFIVLLAIVFFPTLWPKYFDTKKNPEIVLTTFTKDSTKKIILKDATRELTLDKNGDVWNIATYSASPDKIDALFQNLSSASEVSLVSNNPTNAGDYGISSQSATRLILQDSSGQASVLVGNSSSTGTSFYAQKEGSKNIYLMNGGLKDILSTKISDWRDRTVSQFSSDQIWKIDVAGLSPFSLKKNADGKWELEKDGVKKNIDDGDMQQAIGRLSAFDASDFYTEEEAEKLQVLQDKRMVSLSDKDGKTFMSMTIIPGDAYYLVLVQGKSDLYKVAGYNLDNFFELSKQ